MSHVKKKPPFYPIDRDKMIVKNLNGNFSPLSNFDFTPYWVLDKLEQKTSVN